MPAPQPQLDGTAETVDVYVACPFCGDPLDRITGVDLGDRVEAHQNGRDSLYSATLWAYVAQEQHRPICPAL